jgi:alpha/beta superfamily hydrolase
MKGSKRMKSHIVIIVSLAILFVSCTQSGTNTPLAHTDTPHSQKSPTHISPTDTYIPPTPTEIPTDTPTEIPPSPTTTLPPIPTKKPTKTPGPTNQSVEFITEDGVTLRGNLFGEPRGDIGIILTHMGEVGTTRSSWFPFARYIASKDYPALAFDFRGWGSSGGQHSYTNQILDIITAKTLLEGIGFNKIVCIGASMGGTACLKAAMQTDLDGLVVIAGEIPELDYTNLTIPKLVIIADEDPSDDLIKTMTTGFELLPEPKDFVVLSSTAHGTRMFGTDVAEELNAILLNFIEEIPK